MFFEIRCPIPVDHDVKFFRRTNLAMLLLLSFNLHGDFFPKSVTNVVAVLACIS